MSNTSKGRGKKGSKFWIQTLLNLDNGNILSSKILKIDPTIENITWISPLKKENYREFKTKEILEKFSNATNTFVSSDISFWPYQGPWWDAVGVNYEKNTIILVEAKAHIDETMTKCLSKDLRNIELIKQSMKEAHDIIVSDSKYGISNNHIYDADVWFKKYYQLGNRLTFMVQLRKQGLDVKLILLNIIDDPTHIATSRIKWESHYKEVFQSMLGSVNCPEYVVMINFDVG
jgi:hypothetical protein